MIAAEQTPVERCRSKSASNGPTHKQPDLVSPAAPTGLLGGKSRARAIGLSAASIAIGKLSPS